MKKQITLAIGLAVVSGSAFATKARLEALGEDHYGSQFIEDNRNIFLNAAAVNYHKDIVTFEWGAADATDSTTLLGDELPSAVTGALSGLTTDQDQASTPKSEGGFLKASGNMVYGIHFGSESDVANSLRTAAMGLNAVHEQNNVDVFVGGDAGVQWGANLTYSSSKNEQGSNDESQTSLRSRLGMISGNIQAFANINLDNSAEDNANDAEFDGTSGFDLGVTYEMNDVFYMVRHRQFAGEDAEGEEFAANQNWIGIAKAYKLNDRSNVWLSGWYKMNVKESDFTFGTGNAALAAGEIKDNFIPLTVATEVEVKDWLVLRGSVGHVLYGTTEDDDGDEASINKTFVNAGASVVWGDFQIDGLLGTSDGTNTGLENETTGGNGTLRTDALLSRVSMLYRF